MYKLKRSDLNILSSKLSINHKEYSNMTKLRKAIKTNEKYHRYLRTYNECDPCTLQPLHEIKNYIEWKHCKHIVGADVVSLKYMFDNEQYTSPFALELKYILPQSTNYDMRNIKEIMYALETCENRHEPENGTIDQGAKFVFNIEKLCNYDAGYIHGVIMHKLIPKTSIAMKRSLIASMERVLDQLEYDSELYLDIFYQSIVLKYKHNFYPNKDEHLQFLLSLLNDFHSCVGNNSSSIIFLLFNDIR